MPLQLFSTLGRRLEPLSPLRQDGLVGLYTCGPTVYAEAHLGNLRTYIFEDVLKRALLANGYRVRHVMNITDVGHLTGDEDFGEDKVERAAAAERLTAWDLAARYTKIFQDDLASLNVLPPDEWVKATDRIPQQVELVRQLEERGLTYRTSDGIYFDTSKLPSYGRLDPSRLAGQRAGERVDVGEKKNPTDFALWKFSPEGSKRQMEWDSPWGKGFPGWHLECSAICQKAFEGFNPDPAGPWLDIHCGGVDHVSVHHTNEIAQTEGATGRPLAKVWLHGEFLRLAEDKRMGKSEGNALTLRTVAERRVDPLAYRYLVLQAHYRSPLTFTWEALAAAEAGLASLRRQVAQLGVAAGAEPSFPRFLEAVNDDLNTARGLAALHELLGSGEADEVKLAGVAAADAVLGLGLAGYREPEAPAEVRALAEQRERARRARDWATADQLRQQIGTAGWEVSDGPDGWRLRQLRG